MKNFQFLLIILFYSLIKTSAFSQTTPELVINNLQNLLDEKLNEYGMKGAAFTIILPDNQMYTLTSGIASGTNDPVDTIRKWHFASCTKTLTGMVALQMYDQGLLDIDDPIGKYLKTDTIPNVDSAITLKQLLRHTSPLEEVWDESNIILWDSVWSHRQEIWCPWQVLSFMPPPDANRKTHKYSNSNTYVLSALIEEVSGKDLETGFQERIFEPLGMNNSFLSSCKSINMNDLNGVWKGGENRSNLSHDSYLSSRSGNSGLISTTMDVARFFRKYYQDSLISEAIMDSLRIPAPGSRKNIGSIGCASSIVEMYGYETTIFESITSMGDTILLYGHGGNGLHNTMSYHWNKENITLILANNDFTTIESQGALFTNLVCEVYNNLPIVQGSAVIDNKLNEIQISIFPNPVDEFLQVNVNSVSGERRLVNFYNLDGRLVLQASFYGNKLDLSLLSLESGLYIYEIILDRESVKGKIIKS